MSKPRTLKAEESTARTAMPQAIRIVPVSYRVDDAAHALGVSESTVWGLIKKGAIRAKRMGRATIIRRDDLISYVDALPDTKAAQ